MTYSAFWQEIYDQTKKFHNLIFILSGGILTFLMTMNYSVIIQYDGISADSYYVRLWYPVLALVIMLPVYWYLACKKGFLSALFANTNAALRWCSFIFSFAISYQLFLDTRKNHPAVFTVLKQHFTRINWDFWAIHFYNWVIPAVCLLALTGIFVFVLYTFKTFGNFLKDLYATADKLEKVYFVTALIGCVSLICFFYARVTGQWSTVDLVYQIDGKFLYENYYPVFSFGFDFDWDIGIGGVRHPFATLYTYPLYLLASFISNILFFIPNIQAVIYAVFQAVFMILTAILLKRLTKNNWTLLIFTVTCPFILFTVFLEKYPLSVFFLVIFVYAVVNQKGKELSGNALVASGGIMITSAILGFFYGNEKKFVARIKEYVSIFMIFILTLIGSGRIHYILGFMYLREHNFTVFNNVVLTLYNKICAFLNMIAFCLVPIPHDAVLGFFYWTDLEYRFNWFGLLIFVLMILIFCKYRKEKAIQMFALWMLWGIIQYVGIGFSTGCAPLFSLYSGWIVVPTLMIGMRDVIKKPLHQLTFYGTCAILLMYLNYMHMSEIFVFLSEKTPV